MKTLRSSACLLAATLIVGAASAQTTNWKIDPVHSGIEFKIRHLGVSNVRGTLTIKEGVVHLDEKNMTRSSVEAVIDANSVNTNEPPRDTHLKSPDFFNVAQFPTLTFKSTSLANSGGKMTLTGDLTLAGVTKPVTLTLDGPAPPQTDAKGMTRSGFSATGTLHRKDFNFGSKYSAPMLGDDVDFTIDIEMDKQ
jgi:polyisoprenoid-binding protein YceI